MKNMIYASLALALATFGLAACGNSGGGSVAATSTPYTLNQYGQCVQTGTNNPVATNLCNNQYTLNSSGQCVQTNTNVPAPSPQYCQGGYGQYGQYGNGGYYGQGGYGGGYYGQQGGGYGGSQGGYINTVYGPLPQYVCPPGLAYYQHYCITPYGQPIESAYPY